MTNNLNNAFLILVESLAAIALFALIYKLEELETIALSADLLLTSIYVTLMARHIISDLFKNSIQQRLEAFLGILSLLLYLPRKVL